MIKVIYFIFLGFFCFQYSCSFKFFASIRKSYLVPFAGFGPTATTNSAIMLPDPMPNSIGNFFENKTDAMKFIQCYMMSLSKINGTQYGVGFPIDMPVMLTYFEGNELKNVGSDYPDYDHLFDHVSMQMDYNDFQLYKTPVVLTLQGEFEDEDMNNIVTKPVHERLKERFEKKYGYEEGVEEDEDEDDEDWEEVTVDELIKLEGIDEEDFEDGDDFNEDDEYDDDEEEVDQENDDENDQEDPNKDFRSFLNSSPVGKTIDEKYNSLPDYSIYRPEKPDISDIPEDAFVTDEDAKGLRRAHRRADRLFEYASDIAMIASFHFKKKNFHLVKLLDPIFLIGKRIMDIKGYYFTLLDEDETERVKLSFVSSRQST